MTDVTTQDAPITGTADTAKRTGGFIWYELMTTDPEGAKTFYDAVVGWNIGEAAPEFKGYRMIGRSDGGFAGGVLPITPDMEQHGAKPGWLGYVHVADVDQSVANIEAAGGKTWMAATDIANVGRVALVSDPPGAPIYVMTPLSRGDQQSDVFSPDAVQRVGWNELSIPDEKAARQFYGDQFGWMTDDFMPMGEMGEYRFIDHQGLRLGAIARTAPGQLPHWRFYVRVPSIAKAKETVESRGGKIAMGPMEVPGGDHILIGFDPQGAEFALVGGE